MLWLLACCSQRFDWARWRIYLHNCKWNSKIHSQWDRFSGNQITLCLNILKISAVRQSHFAQNHTISQTSRTFRVLNLNTELLCDLVTTPRNYYAVRKVKQAQQKKNSHNNNRRSFSINMTDISLKQLLLKLDLKLIQYSKQWTITPVQCFETFRTATAKNILKHIQ